jgi:hypothetical protein
MVVTTLWRLLRAMTILFLLVLNIDFSLQDLPPVVMVYTTLATRWPVSVVFHEQLDQHHLPAWSRPADLCFLFQILAGAHPARCG